MTARSCHHTCHTKSSRTPLSRCVPGFGCTQPPQTSRRHRSSGVGWYSDTSPSVPSPSSNDVVVTLSPADLASSSPVASLPVRARVVRGVAFSFSLPRCRLRFPSPFPVFPSTPPLSVVPSRWVWGARLEHQPRHRNATQTRAALYHLHRAVLHVDVGLHSQQASTARQAKCAGAVACSAGAVPFSLLLSTPLIFTLRIARFA